ncbi:MAG TPA: xanthine dehydrogenase family protein molybdopterin-binding subunit [Exilispira sp.]|nr:xanthine dehydrogenase family protein molybdopterin-binding subunit [Exilispira sp.]
MDKKESEIEILDKTTKNQKIRVDVWEKLRGEIKYTDDYTFKDILYISIVRSKIQRGKIKSIQLPHIPRGYFVFGPSHIPGSRVWHYLLDDWMFLTEENINFYGEPLLLIAGPQLSICKRLCEEVQIEYEQIKPIKNIVDAFSNEIPPIYQGENGKNIFKKLGYTFGDISILSAEPLDITKILEYETYTKIKKGKENIIIEEILHTGLQEHAYIEPQGFIAWMEDDIINLKGSIQCPFYVLKAICQLLDLPPEKIRIQQAATGGGFGGKEEYPSILASFTALVTYLTKKPSKLILERTEDIETTTKRHPSDIMLRILANKDGKIKSIESDIILDAGAYCGISPIVLARSEIAACGIYKVEAARVEAKAVATNNVISGAFRGFGAPQSFFALETTINHLADKLEISPISIRKNNHLRKGDFSATGGKMRQDVLLSEMLDWINERTDFEKKYFEYRRKSKEFIDKIKKQKPTKRILTLENQIIKYGDIFKGIGISTVFHGCGFTGRGEENIKATVRIKYFPQNYYSFESGDDKNQKYIVEVYVATVEIGQGMLTVFTDIVADIFQIPRESIKIISGDTHLVPDSGPTVASRTTMIVGGLIYDACERIKKSGETDVTLTYKSPDDIKWDEVKSQGDAYPAYSWGVCVTELDFSFLTFTGKINRMTSCFDIGKALNEDAAIGQVIGGFAQGLGWTVMEKCETKDGRIMQRAFTDYAIPTSLDMPEVEVKFFDNPYDKGPFGAKCLGELPFVLSPASILHAYEVATSMHFYKIPLTSELIYNSLLI